VAVEPTGRTAPARRLTFLAALALAACGGPAPEPHFVPEWIRSYYGAMRVERLSPPVASRLMVYASAALYAGLSAGESPEPTPSAGALNGFPQLPRPEARVNGVLTAVAAERVVIDSLLREALPTTRAALARLMDSMVAAQPASEAVRAASADHGARLGLAIVAWSRTDGFDSTRGRPYVAPKGPGLWVNDAPATIYATQNMSGASEFVALDNPANAMRPGAASDRGLILSRPKSATRTLPAVNMSGMSEPYWSQVRPFALSVWNECKVPDPPAYATSSTSALHVNARQVLDAKAGLTAEQRTIALYWADNAGESGTPVGHWLAIAAQTMTADRMPATSAARLMLLMAVAQADAFVASWGYKYGYNLLRPRTYIRRLIQPDWEPLIPTPPFPEYPSGHSTQSSAAATVIAAVVGERAFEDSTSIPIGHQPRRFASFRAAADEAGMSRIYGGIHYPAGNTAGGALGRCIGDKVIARLGAHPAS